MKLTYWFGIIICMAIIFNDIKIINSRYNPTIFKVLFILYTTNASIIWLIMLFLIFIMIDKNERNEAVKISTILVITWPIAVPCCLGILISHKIRK